MYLSVIVPVYNEEGAAAKLHAEILAACQKLNQEFEIIFINDGSKDKTVEVLKTLSPIKIVNLRKNFGQTAAMDAGIKVATGKYLATLDGDGQNDPADIASLIAVLEASGLDVVSGWRKNRQDTKGKRWASLAAAFVRKYLVNDGIHDSGCSLKVYKRECFEKITLYGEMHRFIPAVLKIKGFKIGEAVVNHRARETGVTKYNWKRGVKGGLDMFAVWFWQKYAHRPLHLFGGASVVCFIVFFISTIWAIYGKLFQHIDLTNSSFTMLAMFSFFVAIMFFTFGLTADMLSKIYFGLTKDDHYDVKEVIDRKGE